MWLINPVRWISITIIFQKREKKTYAGK
jgi:hypothetical protein